MGKKLFSLLLVLVISLTGCSKAPSSSTSDTVLWFNAVYAVITSRNDADITMLGGYEVNDSNTAMMKEGLADSWDITDRKTADETLDWLLTGGGHNAEFLDTYDQSGLSDYSREELVESLSDASYTDSDRSYYLGMYDAVAAYGENAIAAWDLSRAMQLCAWYYIADYYTYEEALDKSLEIAKSLQGIYSSWDDMMQSYFYGFQFWNEDDMNDENSESYARRQVYESLKEQKNSPYALDWNYKLQKDW